MKYSFKVFNGHVDLKELNDNCDGGIKHDLAVLASAACGRYVSKNVERIPLDNGKAFFIEIYIYIYSFVIFVIFFIPVVLILYS